MCGPWALGLVGMAHFMGHFYGMALPPLFPFLHQDLGVIIGGVDLHFTVLVFCFTVAGFFSGMIRPARDMMIRNAAPRDATGKVFGFVFSGSSFGGGIAPVVYGFMLDTGKPSWIFYTSAVFMILCMIIVLLSGRAARRIAGRH